MTNENLLTILRELRKATEDLSAGKRNEVINKLNRVELIFKRKNAQTTAPSTNQVDEQNAEVFSSQTKTIYNHLLAGNTLTSMDALRRFGVARLASRICDIERQTGVTPKRRRIQVTNRYGKEVWVNEYWIEQEAN